jgi:hypothetical protein
VVVDGDGGGVGGGGGKRGGGAVMVVVWGEGGWEGRGGRGRGSNVIYNTVLPHLPAAHVSLWRMNGVANLINVFSFDLRASFRPNTELDYMYHFTMNHPG